VTIRLETLKDASQVRRVNEVAFGGTVEADLVDTLRAACPEAVSLVAEDQGTVVGHILFTPVNGEASRGMGLAPMAVLPERQRQGIGSALIHAGLALVRRQLQEASRSS
jgi:putative acetyltransferase